jgi:hypothetical protein
MHKNYDIQLTMLAPVHIGASAEQNWQRAADFVHTDAKIYVLDQQKVWFDLDKRQQQQYVDWLGNGKFDEVERLIVDYLDLESVSTHIFDYDGKLNSREIKTLIRNGLGETYIPGSSIKGAIASALFHYLYNGVNPTYFNDQTAKELLGTFDRALGRYLRPSDSSAIETEINDVELYNLYRKGVNWSGEFKQGFIILLETFKTNCTGSMRLSLAADIAEFVRKQSGKTGLPTYYDNVFGENPLKNLFKIINDYTRTHIEREIKYLETYNDQEDIDSVLGQLDALLLDLGDIKEHSCILRLAFGSGFHGITGDWRFKDHTSTIAQGDDKNMIYNRTTRNKEAARYKSRRLVFPFAGMMGFVRLDAKSY